MGSNTSACLSSSSDYPSLNLKLGDIPESCISLILTHLDPPEICQFARLNCAFHGASSADFIWELKLPSNYRYIIEKLSDEGFELDGLGKKELYGRLCRFNPFDGGTKEVWLDKKTGGVCLLISSKGLSITGIDDRRYWNYIETDESRFESVAYVQQTWWFEVAGEIEFKFPKGNYSLFFRLHLGKKVSKKRLGGGGRRVCNMEHVHGWDIKPVKLEVKTGDGQETVSMRFLDDPGNWVRYHAGDFIVGRSDQMTKIKFWLRQIDCTHTKGGLCVDSVLICPTTYY
ncbi:F-box protein PP2-A13-like [Impatiens glandulifera]|uniref:F-box protein PP2-A13-like n=1 Tax=Impatiens glandulifera TaxID=253017 RepID=UPI001FB18350|nr:F-box protein PP2-A13-like [Impatiens glandulifera]